MNPFDSVHIGEQKYFLTPDRRQEPANSAVYAQVRYMNGFPMRRKTDERRGQWIGRVLNEHRRKTDDRRDLVPYVVQQVRNKRRRQSGAPMRRKTDERRKNGFKKYDSSADVRIRNLERRGKSFTGWIDLGLRPSTTGLYITGAGQWDQVKP